MHSFNRSRDRIGAVLQTHWKCVKILSPKDLLYHVSDSERFLLFEWRDDSFPPVCYFFFFFLCSKSESLFRTVYETGTLLQSDSTTECLSFNLFITVPFYRFSGIKKQ